MDDKYADIRAALDAATPGPWQTYEKCVFFGREGGFCLHDCPRPSENADYIAACHPESIRALLAERDFLNEECLEQARLNGMGSEREARLMAERDALRQALEAIVSHHDDYFKGSTTESNMPWIGQARDALAQGE